MKATVLAATVTGSIHYPSVTPQYIVSSVIVPEDQLRRILNKQLCVDPRHAHTDLAKLIQERGDLTCEVVFSPQDPGQPKDSRDHIFIQFVLHIPTASGQ